MVVRPNASINEFGGKSKTDIDGARFARGFANRVLMSFGDKDGMYKALTTLFTNET